MRCAHARGFLQLLIQVQILTLSLPFSSQHFSRLSIVTRFVVRPTLFYRQFDREVALATAPHLPPRKLARVSDFYLLRHSRVNGNGSDCKAKRRMIHRRAGFLCFFFLCWQARAFHDFLSVRKAASSSSTSSRLHSEAAERDAGRRRLFSAVSGAVPTLLLGSFASSAKSLPEEYRQGTLTLSDDGDGMSPVPRDRYKKLDSGVTYADLQVGSGEGAEKGSKVRASLIFF